MNIQFKSIDIESFRSIDKAHIELSNQGIVIVKGVNEYEDNATSNGSGKSSIFEAIIFTIFEETSSGEKDVENKILGNGYLLVLKFNIDNTEYIIERSLKNNKSTVVLLKDGVDISARNKTDTNKQIISLLGITKDVFLDSVFLSQNVSTNLSSLSPTSRRERLEILTNTDITISKFKEQIKNKQHILESKCVEYQLNKNKLIGNKEVLQQQVLQLEIKIQEIEQEIERKKQLGNVKDIEDNINNCNTEIDILTTSITDLESKNGEIDLKITDLNNETDELTQQQNNLQNDILKQQSKVSELQFDISHKDSDIQHIQQTIENLKLEINKIKNSDTCPTCGRKYDNVDENHIQELLKNKEIEVQENVNKIEDLNKSKHKLYKNLSAQNEMYDNLKHKSEELFTSINNIRSNIQKYEKEKADNVNVKSTKNAEITQLRNRISQLQLVKEELLKTENNNLNEYKSQLSDYNNQIAQLHLKIQECDNQFEIYDNLVNTAKHIIHLITKDFRTYLLKNSIDYLNTLLLDYSQKLFSNSGDVIKIENMDSKLNIKLGNTNYESLSGGERTRVNIALLLAQKSLASTIGNINCNIIILDEILGYCDSTAELKVIDLILSELETLETIYMVSHKEISIPYDIQLTVTKNKQGLSSVSIY